MERKKENKVPFEIFSVIKLLSNTSKIIIIFDFYSSFKRMLSFRGSLRGRGGGGRSHESEAEGWLQASPMNHGLSSLQPNHR